MSSYSTDPEWADVTPLPTDIGGANPLAAIAYPPQYEETMSYLRAVMAANEFSHRVLQLTSDLIEMNPAHYTVWLYRAQCLFALTADLQAELEWLNETALDHQKNYQIWHHRMLIVDKLDKSEGEGEFVEQMFELDAKNYHVWSYRQWMVKRFGLWGDDELAFTQRMVESDVRNNSAWNHRWFVVNGAPGAVGVKDEATRQREMEFAMHGIRKAPQNQCGWSYLRGVATKGCAGLVALKEFVAEYASVDRDQEVKSSYALDLMADIFAEEDRKEEAAKALDLLAQRYDPIRKNYWEYRKGLLGLPAAAAA